MEETYILKNTLQFTSQRNKLKGVFTRYHLNTAIGRNYNLVIPPAYAVRQAGLVTDPPLAGPESDETILLISALTGLPEDSYLISPS